MTHSPSPWRRAGENSGHIWAPDGDGVVQVAIVGAYSSRDMLSFNKERWDADARLISAAPEMLEALAATVMILEKMYQSPGLLRAEQEVLTMARDAIAKVRGTT